MRSFFAVVLFALVASVFAQDAAFGTAVSVTGSITSTITFSGTLHTATLGDLPLLINVTVLPSANTDITVDVDDTPPTSVGSVTPLFGLTISSSVNTVYINDMQIKAVASGIPSAFGSQLGNTLAVYKWDGTGTTNAAIGAVDGGVYYDAASESVITTSYNSPQSETFTPLGTYLVGSLSGTIRPAFYEQAAPTPFNSYTTLSYPDGFTVKLQSGDMNGFIATVDTTTSHPLPTGYTSLGVYYDFRFSQQGVLAQDATLTYDFSSNTAYNSNNLAATSIKWAFWNSATTEWEFVLSGNSVTGTVATQAEIRTQFSNQWALFGTVGPNNSAGDGTDTDGSNGAASVVISAALVGVAAFVVLA